MASSSDQMLNGSVSCFQLCPTPGSLLEQSSSWTHTSPKVAEPSPIPTQKHSKGAVLSPVCVCGVAGGGLRLLSCSGGHDAAGGQAGPLQDHALWVGGREI